MAVTQESAPFIGITHEETEQQAKEFKGKKLFAFYF
jgi:hypothetical protein